MSTCTQAALFPSDEGFFVNDFRSLGYLSPGRRFPSGKTRSRPGFVHKSRLGASFLPQLAAVSAYFVYQSFYGMRIMGAEPAHAPAGGGGGSSDAGGSDVKVSKKAKKKAAAAKAEAEKKAAEEKAAKEKREAEEAAKAAAAAAAAAAVAAAAADEEEDDDASDDEDDEDE